MNVVAGVSETTIRRIHQDIDGMTTVRPAMGKGEQVRRWSIHREEYPHFMQPSCIIGPDRNAPREGTQATCLGELTGLSSLL
jgi:hypothetical protein